MLHVWNIYLHDWAIYFWGKCRWIFQHHGSHLGMLPSNHRTPTWNSRRTHKETWPFVSMTAPLLCPGCPCGHQCAHVVIPMLQWITVYFCFKTYTKHIYIIFIYTHIHLYVYMYVYIYIHVYVPICIYTCVYCIYLLYIDFHSQWDDLMAYPTDHDHGNPSWFYTVLHDNTWILYMFHAIQVLIAWTDIFPLPSGKRLHNNGKSPCYSVFQLAIFNSKLWHIAGRQSLFNLINHYASLWITMNDQYIKYTYVYTTYIYIYTSH